MKRATMSAMKSGAKGIKICCAGRLQGAEIARTEWERVGSTPLHTLRSNVDYGFAEALTTYGLIGVKVWICKGEFHTCVIAATWKINHVDAKENKIQKSAKRFDGGLSKGGRTVMFGEYGLQAVEPVWLTAQQIESVRVTINRKLKKVGKLFLRVFPDKPVT